jgi:hypothetical protein
MVMLQHVIVVGHRGHHVQRHVVMVLRYELVHVSSLMRSFIHALHYSISLIFWLILIIAPAPSCWGADCDGPSIDVCNARECPIE